MADKIIKNPVTGSIYRLRKRSEVNPNAGKVEGRWMKRLRGGSKIEEDA